LEKCRRFFNRTLVSTPTILHGKPRVKDTRIPVSIVLAYLAAGKSTDEIIAEYPELTEKHISACLDYARELADYNTVV